MVSAMHRGTLSLAWRPIESLRRRSGSANAWTTHHAAIGLIPQHGKRDRTHLQGLDERILALSGGKPLRQHPEVHAIASELETPTCIA